jgi:hypothetical protein
LGQPIRLSLPVLPGLFARPPQPPQWPQPTNILAQMRPTPPSLLAVADKRATPVIFLLTTRHGSPGRRRQASALACATRPGRAPAPIKGGRAACPSPAASRTLPPPRLALERRRRLGQAEPASSPQPQVSPPPSSSGANRCHHHVHLAEMEPARRFPSIAVHRNPIAAESARRPWRTAAAPSKSGNLLPSPPPVSTNP